MALRLKSGRTFTDNASVDHDEGFLGVISATSSPGHINLFCGIWKDEASFLTYLSDGSVAPIVGDIIITISGQDFIDYVATPIAVSSPIVLLKLMNDRFFQFMIDKQPQVLRGFIGSDPLIDWNDWEIVVIPGVPAHQIPK